MRNGTQDIDELSGKIYGLTGNGDYRGIAMGLLSIAYAIVIAAKFMKDGYVR